MFGLSGLDREGLLDGASNAVPLAIITLLTLLFVAYNPWGWHDTLVIVEVFGLHLVPILTLVPVTYLAVKVVNESSEGRSETADRIRSGLALTDEPEDDGATETDGARETSAETRR